MQCRRLEGKLRVSADPRGPDNEMYTDGHQNTMPGEGHVSGHVEIELSLGKLSCKKLAYMHAVLQTDRADTS